MSPIETLSLFGAILIPVLIAAGSVVHSANVRRAAGDRAYSTKVLEMDRIHKTKMLELAVNTANSEFEVSQELLKKNDAKPRPMSSYVIFHFFLFQKLESIRYGYDVDDALQETFDEVNKIFEVYARSGIADYGTIWNIDIPKPIWARRTKAAANSRTEIERRADFMVIEHASLQEKIRHASTDLYRTETIIPIAIGLTYAWLYSGETISRAIPAWMWWVPVVLVAFGVYRQRLRYRSLWASHEYVQLIEREFYGARPKSDDPRPLGWESHWLADANRFHKLFGLEFSSHGLMRILFWFALFAGCTALAIQKTLW